jgi:hypothetical protein
MICLFFKRIIQIVYVDKQKKLLTFVMEEIIARPTSRDGSHTMWKLTVKDFEQNLFELIIHHLTIEKSVNRKAHISM